MENAENKAEQEMAILEGSPIEIKIGGQSHTVKKLTLKKQREAIKSIQDHARNFNQDDLRSGILDAPFEMMIHVVSISTGISLEDLDQKADLIEIGEAFKALWKQNRFDFLLKTIGEIGTILQG